MKITPRIILIVSLLGWSFIACNKGVDPPNNGTTGTPAVGGTTSTYNDTVIVTLGTVTLKYSKTSACYPSNEIFAFDAAATGLPSGATYNWDFGDGQTATGSTVKNIYETSGSYTVKCIIKNSAGTVLSTTTVNVKALGQQVTPHAVFSSQIYDVNYPNNMAFTSQSSVQRGTLTNYFWDWGDGSTTSTVNAYTPHNFPQVANDIVYPVKLVATANSGCKDTATVVVSVAAVYAPSGSFDAVSYDVCSNEYFIFTPTVTGIPSGCVFTWDFADASGTATGNPVKHYFTYQNTYDVKMTVTYKGNIIYKTNKSVNAQGQNIRPKALFIKNVKSEDATSVSWAFYSQSIIPHGAITGYRWEFSNGTVDDNYNTYIEQTYKKITTSQTQSVRFIVTGNSGCKDTATGTFVIPAL